MNTYQSFLHYLPYEVEVEFEVLGTIKQTAPLNLHSMSFMFDSTGKIREGVTARLKLVPWDKIEYPVEIPNTDIMAKPVNYIPARFKVFGVIDDPYDMNYGTIDILMQMHVDVLGMFEQGLAVDKTLKPELPCLCS